MTEADWISDRGHGHTELVPSLKEEPKSVRLLKRFPCWGHGDAGAYPTDRPSQNHRENTNVKFKNQRAAVFSDFTQNAPGQTARADRTDVLIGFLTRFGFRLHLKDKPQRKRRKRLASPQTCVFENVVSSLFAAATLFKDIYIFLV